MSKKAITTALVAAMFATVGFSNNATAQQKRAVIQGQPKAKIQQRGRTQRLVVDPGFNQPKPKLGFDGQLIYNYGMKVISVNWGSAAKRAGLERGDVITKINGRMIRSQWDYDQALSDAARFQNGRVTLKVRNVRYDWGHNVPKYAVVHAVLDGYWSGPGPVGPVGPRVAAQKY